jgi:putative addiction module CopG family antidote
MKERTRLTIPRGQLTDTVVIGENLVICDGGLDNLYLVINRDSDEYLLEEISLAEAKLLHRKEKRG